MTWLEGAALTTWNRLPSRTEVRQDGRFAVLVDVVPSGGDIALRLDDRPFAQLRCLTGAPGTIVYVLSTAGIDWIEIPADWSWS